VRSEVPSPPEKLQRTSKAPAQLYCPPTPDFSNLVRHMSNLYCPQAYSTSVSHPMSTSRLWIVGIMSVGTESVGIACCTPIPIPNHYPMLNPHPNPVADPGFAKGGTMACVERKPKRESGGGASGGGVRGVGEAPLKLKAFCQFSYK